MLDWSKLPDLAAAAALTCAFASVAQRSEKNVTYRLWLIGWGLIALNFAALLFLPARGLRGMLANDIGLICLTSAGVLFMWASVPYREERSSRWMLISLLTTATLYWFVVGFDHPERWALNISALLFGAAPLAIAVVSRRRFTHVLRWVLVGLYCLLSVFLLAFQHRQGDGRTLAVNAVLFAVYFGCCIHVWYCYRGRGSAGSLISIVGFLGWAAAFVLGPFADAFAQGTSIDSEVWNLPKYVVAVGMILVLLEDQINARTRLAFIDDLTDLPNRRSYSDRLDSELNRARASGAQFAVLVVDLDRFKQVNDSIGHDAGDQVLKHSAQRLRNCVRRIDTVARTGGDEFCLILSSPAGRREANMVAKSIEQAIDEPIVLGGKKVQIGASVGIAIFPEDARDSKLLNFVADSRMYETKRGRKER